MKTQFKRVIRIQDGNNILLNVTISGFSKGVVDQTLHHLNEGLFYFSGPGRNIRERIENPDLPVIPTKDSSPTPIKEGEKQP